MLIHVSSFFPVHGHPAKVSVDSWPHRYSALACHRCRFPHSVQQGRGWESKVKRGVHTLKKPEYELLWVRTPWGMPAHLADERVNGQAAKEGSWLFPDSVRRQAFNVGKHV